MRYTKQLERENASLRGWIDYWMKEHDDLVIQNDKLQFQLITLTNQVMNHKDETKFNLVLKKLDNLQYKQKEIHEEVKNTDNSSDGLEAAFKLAKVAVDSAVKAEEAVEAMTQTTIPIIADSPAWVYDTITQRDEDIANKLEQGFNIPEGQVTIVNFSSDGKAINSVMVWSRELGKLVRGDENE